MEHQAAEDAATVMRLVNMLRPKRMGKLKGWQMYLFAMKPTRGKESNDDTD